MAKTELDRIIDTPETADVSRASWYASGAGRSTSILLDHTHSSTAGDGGNILVAVTTNWKSLLLSATATMQAALDQLDTYGMFVKTAVDSGVTLTIPSGYQQMVYGPYTITGDIIIAGDLIIF